MKVIDVMVTDREAIGAQADGEWRFEAFAMTDADRGIGGIVGYSDTSEAEAKKQLQLTLDSMGIMYSPEVFGGSVEDDIRYARRVSLLSDYGWFVRFKLEKELGHGVCIPTGWAQEFARQSLEAEIHAT